MHDFTLTTIEEQFMRTHDRMRRIFCMQSNCKKADKRRVLYGQHLANYKNDLAIDAIIKRYLTMKENDDEYTRTKSFD